MKTTPHRGDTLTKLANLYTFYHDFLRGYGFACAPGCATCCTVNVIATSLELDYMLEMKRGIDVLKRGLTVLRERDVEYYRPRLTINEEAKHYMMGVVPPEEQSLPDRACPCPLLDSKGLCTVYERRPFACRAMVSSTQCNNSGAAQMDPFLITVNLSIQQVIEHLDQGGAYGNLWDLIDNILGIGKGETHLKVCRNTPGFLVTPQERPRFNAFLRRLNTYTGLSLDLT